MRSGISSGWIIILIFLPFILFQSACHRPPQTLFQLLPPSRTGINFDNVIHNTDSLNILNYQYLYNGGGVAIGDFNRDGKQDIYFTGNMVSNRLYLNEGNYHFKDVTKESNTGGEGKWCTGVAVVDINNDGWPDIYVCVSEAKNANMRKNILYVNQGLDKNGVPVFKDEAAEYGLDDTTFSTQAAFFDYDRDGLLDMYLVVDKMEGDREASAYRKPINDGTSQTNDRLYHGSWSDSLHHIVFTDVTKKAGIIKEGFGLGVNVCDINHDGWPDIYVTDDFLSNDLLWINNHDGTFTDESAKYFKHTSASAMGNDIEDINNDGLPDVVALDMFPANNLRKKMMMNPDNYQSYLNNIKYGYQYQYSRNTLQLNDGPTVKGDDTVGHPIFSEIGFLAGIAATDWSWTPMVADFNNDGYRDIIITNGFPKDITDHDFMAYRAVSSEVASIHSLLPEIPAVRLPKYAFRNNGNLTFTNRSAQWGVNVRGFSNGAAYADLNNDGALDLVVNNINGPAYIFRNTLNEDPKKIHPHWIQVMFRGSHYNGMGLGTRVEIYYSGNKKQVYENTPYRGYLSSIENMAHFGLGKVSLIDSMRVIWPNDSMQVLYRLKTDRDITVDIRNALIPYSYATPMVVPHLFTDVTDALHVHYVQQELDFVDFAIQKLLPHKLSQYGPALAVGDVDGNGTDDIFIGGSFNHKGKFLLQGKDGQFKEKDLLPGQGGQAKMQEDEGALLFDANGDGLPDLYIVSGSVENPPGSPNYQDRFYLNKGHGKFEEDSAALPVCHISGSCVKAADYDRDGDLDLFVGGRVNPGSYPMPVSSRILRNDSRDGQVKFTDVTDQVAPFLHHIGMVTDAIWTDFNNDGWPDLILVGEWMPVTFLENDHGKKFINVTDSTGIENQVGWWNSIVGGDFNNDGKIDYIVGNLGLNSLYRGSDKYPVSIYAKDFDGDGYYDAIPTLYFPDSEGVLREYPAFGRDDMIKQMNSIRRQFPDYHSYAVATIHDILSPQQLHGALIYRANNMQSCYIENMGNGKFRMSPLPMKAQFAPIYGMVVDDVDGDGNLDLVCNGNDFGTEVFTGRYDALNGLVLKGDGKGHFTPESIAQSGIYIPGDGKSLVKLLGPRNTYLLAAGQNQGPVKVFRDNDPCGVIRLQPMDAYALIHYRNGKTRKEEFYYGSSFLSESGRFLRISPLISSVDIYDFEGKSRHITLQP
ncbi:MAG TPA: VCBS repeat-containing protein [Chitinophagaceae bacterium]|nr:VCBS repeat-containing protein [Chitinophagaceae bacterium]